MFNKFSIAPLLNYTDKHCRYFYSLFTNYLKLYTGMIHTSSFLYRYKKGNLSLNNILNVKVGIQFIGNNLKELYYSSKIVKKLNFSEINFNVGCPSLSAKYGNFGFYLSKNIKKVIDCLNSIRFGNPDILISLKHRINLLYSYNSLLDFVGNINLFTGCNLFIIHARSILKNNYSTRLNLKSLLNYNLVYKLKKDLPHINFVINGNIKNLYEINNHLKYVDGVMMGRNVYFNPLILFFIDKYFYNLNIGKYNYINKINNNNFFWINNKLNYNIRNIFYKIFFYIKKEIYINNTKPINILKHIIHIFYNINYSSILRKRLLKSSLYFKYFNSYLDFEYFLFKDILY